MSAETELIKERLDIAAVVGDYVPLKKAGRNLKGLCPFHQEKTASFIVSPQRGTWHCFGCNEGGDAFSFIQKIEGLDFPAALKMLAERAGVELKTQSRASTNRRQRLFDLLELATQFYHEILINQGAGKKAKDYLKKRGVQLKTMKEFRVGYAPDSWDSLQQWLRKKNFTEDEMIAAGVVGRSDRGRLFDRFRGRIMFPVADTQGRVVAFGGRITPWHETGNEGKYINSPEGSLYEKRRIVYNLDRAKAKLRGDVPCLVVEGYMDVVMLHQVGLENVVGSSGTAFTEDQIGQLKRFTNTLHFAFDADTAGFKAGVAATQGALAQGMKVATISMPKGSDPADIALKGKREVNKVFSKPRSLIGVLLEQLSVSDEYDQEQQLEALLPLLLLVNNPIQQGKMVQEVAKTLRIPEDRVITLLRTIEPQRAVSSEVSAEDSHVQRDSLPLSEQQLLGLLIHRPNVREALFEHVQADFLLDPACVSLYNSMQQLYSGDKTFLSMVGDDVVGALPESEVAFAEGVVTRAEELLVTTSNTSMQEGRLLLRSLQRRSIKERLLRLQQSFADAGEKDREHALEDFRALTEELARIDL